MTISPFVKPVQIPLKHNTKVEFSAPEVISGVLLTFTPLKALKSLQKTNAKGRFHRGSETKCLQNKFSDAWG